MQSSNRVYLVCWSKLKTGEWRQERVVAYFTEFWAAQLLQDWSSPEESDGQGI
jgi:hypothetical protein